MYQCGGWEKGDGGSSIGSGTEALGEPEGEKFADWEDRTATARLVNRSLA